MYGLNDDQEAGNSHTILEGRDTANAGMYQPSGEMRFDLPSDILDAFSHEKLIIETPNKKTELQFIPILLLGANVNHGSLVAKKFVAIGCSKKEAP